MIQPIKPEEIARKKQEVIPDYVVEIINRIIAEKWNGASSVIKQSDIVARIRDYNFQRNTLTEHFNTDWLEFEDIYRSAGWKIRHDKPAYNETYPATFTFSK